jgi:hypothetical protein
VGEKQNQSFQLSFNSSLKVDFQGSRVTSDGGVKGGVSLLQSAAALSRFALVCTS